MTHNGTVSPSKVLVFPGTNPGYTHASSLSEESARKTSELLTLNHDLYHTRWKATFHNHIVHHLLALWALGATPAEIQDMYDYNVPYQAPIRKANDSEGKTASLNLRDPEVFDRCLGVDDAYADFMQFFENEIAEKGVPAVVNEYILKGDNRANDIHGRMYTDLVHPMIHLGCGIEFQQPSLIVEALAGACVHENWPKTFLLATEQLIRFNPDLPTAPLVQVLDSLRHDPVVASGVKDTDPFNKIPDGLLKRVHPLWLAPHLAQFRVIPTPDGLQRGLSEIMYTAAYMMAAAQRPGKREAMDFVTLHSVTIAAYYPAILAQNWLSNSDKARLLETKARVDAVMYAGTGCPTLYPERILEYEPRYPHHGWTELFQRAIVYRDEGHAAKLVRALFATSQMSLPSQSALPIKREHMVTIAHMAMDSIESAFEEGGCTMPAQQAEAIAKRIGFGGEMVVRNQIRWVFYGGLDRAWDHKPDRTGEPTLSMVR